MAGSPQVSVEVCCTSICEWEKASAAGCQRIELCFDLAVGGVTPTEKTLRALAATARKGLVPVHILLRPRAGDFVYTAHEYEELRRSLVFCRDELPAEFVGGVVFGLLLQNVDGKTLAIDEIRCRELVALAKARRPPMETTFHRAFDSLPKEEVVAGRTIDTLVSLGFDRLLTSGLAPTAHAGIPILRSLVSQSRSKGNVILVVPGGSVRPENVAELVTETGCSQVHSSCSPSGHLGYSDDVLVELLKVLS